MLGQPTSRWLLDGAVALSAISTAVNFNSELLGLASNEQAVRVGLQLCVVGSAGLAAVMFPDEARPRSLTSAQRWLLGFFVVGALSSLWAADPLRAVSQSVTGLAVVMSIAIHAAVISWQRTLGMCVVTFGGVLVVSGILELLDSGAGLRWEGIAGSATQLAQLAVLIAALALVGAIHDRSMVFFAAVTSAFAAVVIGLSQSRVALATLVALVAVTVVICSPRRARPPRVLALAFGSLSLMVVALPLITQLALRDSDDIGDLGELTGRTTIWPRSLELWSEQPFFGHGFASGETLWSLEVMHGSVNWNPTNAHNVALEALLSLGLVGLVLIAGVCVSIARTPHAARSTGVMLLAPVLVLGVTESMIHYAAPSFLVLAVAATPSRSTADRHEALVGSAR